MLMFGPKVTDTTTPLRKVEIRQIVALMRNPNKKLAKYVQHLRQIIHINYDAYNKRKRSLPYVVPSIFSPPFRRLDNFVYSTYFIIDLDKLSEAGFKPDNLKKELKNDSRIELMFVSPSENGLKIFFHLDFRISDTSEYKAFYKKFAMDFANAYSLIPVIDLRTNDATRACFLSYDPDLYYNPNAERLSREQFRELLEPLAPAKKDKEIEREFKQKNIVKKKQDSLDPEILTQIKQKLNPNYRPRNRERIITVPEELTLVEQKIRDFIEEQLPQIKLVRVKDINYGKQLLFQYDTHYAEFNVFFGKKGITLIKTTKKLNDREFQELMYQLLSQIIYGYDTISPFT